MCSSTAGSTIFSSPLASARSLSEPEDDGSESINLPFRFRDWNGSSTESQRTSLNSPSLSSEPEDDPRVGAERFSFLRFFFSRLCSFFLSFLCFLSFFAALASWNHHRTLQPQPFTITTLNRIKHQNADRRSTVSCGAHIVEWVIYYQLVCELLCAKHVVTALTSRAIAKASSFDSTFKPPSISPNVRSTADNATLCVQPHQRIL